MLITENIRDLDDLEEIAFSFACTNSNQLIAIYDENAVFNGICFEKEPDIKFYTKYLFDVFAKSEKSRIYKSIN